MFPKQESLRVLSAGECVDSKIHLLAMCARGHETQRVASRLNEKLMNEVLEEKHGHVRIISR